MGLLPLKETPDCSPVVYPSCEDTMTGQQSAVEKNTFTRPQLCWHPDFRLLTTRTVRIKFLLFRSHSVYEIFLEPFLTYTSGKHYMYSYSISIAKGYKL